MLIRIVSRAMKQPQSRRHFHHPAFLFLHAIDRPLDRHPPGRHVFFTVLIIYAYVEAIIVTEITR